MIRTRFAPSPTGYMHIGNLRTALYAYCIARHAGGKFLLRLEDTDRKRNNPKAVQVIFDSLRLAGLEHDEGPDIGGPCGPYVQSERKEQGLYRQYAEELVASGQAYRCFCAAQAQAGTDAAAADSLNRARRNPCRNLTAAQIEENLQKGWAFVIRQRIPDDGATTFHDLVFGDIAIKNSQLDEQILLKSDGFPTYNFANVVDDHLMEITHVARGVEYLSSTPKYNLLYQAFGWEIPNYIHLPLIVKPSGEKLSKRKGDASFQDLIARGYLPEAILNYIALLGWSPGDNRELFRLPELVQQFEISRINKSRAAFTIEKLDWLNGEYIRALTAEEFHQRALPFIPARFRKALDTRQVCKVIQTRVNRLGEIPQLIDFLLNPPEYSLELFNQPKSKSTFESSRLVLQAACQRLAKIKEWTEESVRLALVEFGSEAGLKTGTVMWPVRIALSGLQSTPGGATEIAAILGKRRSLRRLAAAVDQLG